MGVQAGILMDGEGEVCRVVKLGVRPAFGVGFRCPVGSRVFRCVPARMLNEEFFLGRSIVDLVSFAGKGV
ncbi:hypothetical protein ACFLX5_00345 [Chloroflexota bacterium]